MAIGVILALVYQYSGEAVAVNLKKSLILSDINTSIFRKRKS